jgi:hypothetical protein
MGTTFHEQYCALISGLEKRFPVAQWRRGDVDLWPLARMSVYLDLYRQKCGWAPADSSRALPLRVASNLLRPLTNLWHSRHDLRGAVIRPRPAYAIFLGDGVSLDPVDGAWVDRVGEPLIAALQRLGRQTFLMQSGGFSRLPWHRPTFMANVAESWGWLLSWGVTGALELPAHEAVVQFLTSTGLNAPSLGRSQLARRAAMVSATATVFGWILRAVRPRVAFVVSYFAGLGPAFVLACRRRGVLCIDLQRAPLEGSPMAYRWHELPEQGYTLLPDLFWNWSTEDAASVGRWALPPWHRSLHGGHLQLAAAGDAAPQVQWGSFEREILVALQPIGGHLADWNALAAVIEAAPRSWRWWIRRHPASAPSQDAEFGRLLSLRLENVMISAASAPLPALLPHMSVLLSLNSGAAVEAAMFGVPSLFLSPEAGATFGRLIQEGDAVLTDVRGVSAAISRLPRTAPRAKLPPVPDLEQTLKALEDTAASYHPRCRVA